MKKNNPSSLVTVIRWSIAPILSLVVWLTLVIVILLGSDISPTVLSFNHRFGSEDTQQYLQLKTGAVFKGSFRARENFLGIVSIEFKKEVAPIQGVVRFRIREKGSSNWLAENTYDARQFYYLNNYPFGFPIVTDSKNKIYEFEMTSEFGADNQAVAANISDPIVVTKYKFSAEYLLAQPARLISFTYKKLDYSVSSKRFIKLLFLVSIPFFSYYVYLFLGGLGILNSSRLASLLQLPVIKFHLNGISVLNNRLGYLLGSLLFLDIFILSKNYDLLSAFIILLWAVALFKFKLRSGSEFFIALVLLYLMILLMLLELETTAEKTALWIYYFLILGTLHGLVELGLNREKK